MRNVVRSTIATVLAMLTAWAATWSWSTLALDDRAWIRPSIVLLATLLATGIVLRAVRLGAATTLIAETVVGLGVVSWQLSGSPFPIGGRASLLASQVHHAIDLSSHVKPPAPVAGGVLPLLLAGTVVAVVLVDCVAVGLHRPALAGAGLLGIWAVTFWNGPVHLHWWAVAATAVGFCLVLLYERQVALSRWGDRVAAGLTASGLGIGGVAVVVAVLVPAIVPTTGLHWFHGGGGHGESGRLTVTNPMVGMRRELTQGPDSKLMTVHTDDPAPAYLRLAVLTSFHDNQWTPGSRNVPSQNSASGALPPPPGLNGTTHATTYDYDITATRAFESRWLPTQAPITDIVAKGDWRYDSRTMDFLAAGQGLTTKGLTWTMTGAKLNLTPELLASLAPVDLVGEEFLDLPDDFPSSISDLAVSVTSGATSDFAKAVALQRWFRTDGGFTYDTSTSLGDGTDDLVTFLSEGPDGRRGFCQQFAAAMAAMARSLGIPARVAVGFLQPDKVAADTWVYSAHDLHAWPELYFQGAGWVRFEPTPSVRAPGVPDYTEHVDEGTPLPSQAALPTQTPTKTPTGPVAPRPHETTSTSSTDASSHRTLLLIVGGLAVVALVLVLPTLIRRVRRRRRLSRALPEDLWAELRDTAVDLGVVWPETASVRLQAAAVRAPAEAAPALGRLVTVVERSRYSAQGVTSADGEDLRTVRRSLVAAAGPRAKRRERFLPPSLFR